MLLCLCSEPRCTFSCSRARGAGTSSRLLHPLKIGTKKRRPRHGVDSRGLLTPPARPNITALISDSLRAGLAKRTPSPSDRCDARSHAMGGAGRRQPAQPGQTTAKSGTSKSSLGIAQDFALLYPGDLADSGLQNRTRRAVRTSASRSGWKTRKASEN